MSKKVKKSPFVSYHLLEKINYYRKNGKKKQF